jgi:hypothetical protein
MPRYQVGKCNFHPVHGHYRRGNGTRYLGFDTSCLGTFHDWNAATFAAEEGFLPQACCMACCRARTAGDWRAEMKPVSSDTSYLHRTPRSFLAGTAAVDRTPHPGPGPGPGSVEIFAIAQAGKTVFAPSPVKPENSPFTSMWGGRLPAPPVNILFPHAP